jgi:hypothetical protein
MPGEKTSSRSTPGFICIVTPSESFLTLTSAMGAANKECLKE